jgi:gamma-D-glutamyl-L-lysine dipeptidyl-peptidase
MIQTVQICINHSEKIMMNTAINLLSVIPMRKEPSHRSEMVSQLLFGEYAEILEEEAQFLRVKCLYDDYEGWVQANQLTKGSEGQILSTDKYIGVQYENVFVNQRPRNIPFAIPVYNPRSDLQFGNLQVRYNLSDESIWNAKKKPFNKNNLQYIINLFLDTPYLWGGKSIFGIDCSGFVQQVFKLFARKLLRDAYLQAEQGSSIKDLADTQLGDLAFFQNEKGRVTHVGIILENHQIVHASGKVRIDTIDEKGIVNKETGERTHQLHSMRRYF